MSKAELLRIAEKIPAMRDDSMPGFVFSISDDRRPSPKGDSLLRRTWADIVLAAEAAGLTPPPKPAVVDDLAAWVAEWGKLHSFCISGGDLNSDDAVSSTQLTSFARITRTTLNEWMKKGKFPQPDAKGGKGKANYWKWSRARGPLSKLVAFNVPEKFPGNL